ncbi:MAG: purine-nucleoside phosphorylase [Halobacteriovoraceae bacterium]|nr:purine-nucleoside phosphorylase [Halobacteriovoraceae bacterium]|tara:strand:+ start:22702 stop:23520 length:819 start_codon:yes stop_codon:yes gene_type:complete
MKEIMESVDYIKNKLSWSDEPVGVILGSGLGSFTDNLSDKVALSYQDIPNFSKTTVVGHAGELVKGSIANQTVLAMRGRFHLYEGHPVTSVVLPIRVLIQLGCKKIIITNAAGGINDKFHPADLVLISDHINFMGQNPLSGPNFEELGPRFPDMSEAYSPKLRNLAKTCGERLNIELKEGVYAGWLGPSYETPAEIRMLKTVGADLVGMSTVPETIAAQHAGAEVLGISCVTNYAAGISHEKLSHADVKDVADKVKDRFGSLVTEIIKGMND